MLHANCPLHNVQAATSTTPSLNKLFHGLTVSDIWEFLLCDPRNSNAH